MYPSVIYSSKILLAYATILSRRTLVLFLLSHSSEMVHQRPASLSRLLNCEIPISDDGVREPLLFLYFLLFFSCLEAGSFELTSVLSVLPITGPA